MLSNQLPSSSEYVAKVANPKGEFYFQWHLTDKCNLRCAHCYQDDYSQSSELPLEDLKNIARKIEFTLEKWGKEGS